MSSNGETKPISPYFDKIKMDNDSCLITKNASNEWINVRLGNTDYFKLVTGGTPSTKKPEFWSGNVPWLVSGDIHKKIIFSVEGKISQLGYKNSNATLIPKQSILIALAGQGKTRGTAAIIEIELTTNQSVAAVIPNKDLVDPYFVYYYIDSLYKKLRNMSAGDGRAGLSIQILKDIEIKIPEIKEQHKIAAILGILDIMIDETDRIIILTEQIKNGLIQELMIKGIGHISFKESQFGAIPVEWSVQKLSDICSLIKDGTHLPPSRVEDGPWLLSVQNMINGKLQLSDSDTKVPLEFYHLMHKNWQIKKGDILLAIVGATIGKTAIVPDMETFTIQRSVAVLRGKEYTLDNRFLYIFLSSKIGQKIIKSRANQTAQPGIYLDILSKIKIPLPPIDEQLKISAAIMQLEDKICIENNFKIHLKQLKNGLMQDLLTGRIRVKLCPQQSQEAPSHV